MRWSKAGLESCPNHAWWYTCSWAQFAEKWLHKLACQLPWDPGLGVWDRPLRTFSKNCQNLRAAENRHGLRTSRSAHSRCIDYQLSIDYPLAQEEHKVFVPNRQAWLDKQLYSFAYTEETRSLLFAGDDICDGQWPI